MFTEKERAALEFIFRIPMHFEGKAHQVEAVGKLVKFVYEEVLPLWRKEAEIPESDIHQVGLDLIKKFEGFRSEAYPDAIHGWDVPTIGYGTTKYPSGQRVEKGDFIVELKASEILEAQCAMEYWPAVRALPFFNQMSEGQRGAMLSFAYNLGANFFGANGFETISKMLTERRWAEVPAALMLYVNPGSDAEEGLRRRRAAEGKLWGQYWQASKKFGRIFYQDFEVSSPFGLRTHPISGKQVYHNGVDFPTPIGTSVLSPIEGTVTIAAELAGYGHSIQIQGKGYSVFFAHLREDLKVVRGDAVGRGFLVGLTGNSGTSTGPHLHFEVGELQDGGGIKLIDPMEVL